MPDRKPRRIIAAAMFHGEIGPITAQELVGMPETRWGMLRDRITDYRNQRPAGLLCSCMMCDGPVFIQARKKSGKPLPLFAHFQGNNSSCPWHHGTNKNPDDVRAAQYKGKQESLAHRLLCDRIDAMARMDDRYLSSTVAAYRSPTESEHGRFPDVAIRWRGFPEFVVEVQLSNTFQTEISARCTHYEREGVPLLWVLYGFDPELQGVPQSFIDIIRRHRGNAFVIDQEAITASVERKTIVLKCYLQNSGEGFSASKLVTIDELTFPKIGLPYLDDRITKEILAKIDAARRPCFAFLGGINGLPRWIEKNSPERKALFTSLRSITPNLSIWESTAEQEEEVILRLISAIFSIIATANGKPKNYATQHPNIVAMLNTWLQTRHDIPRYALIFEFLLKRTPLAHLLNQSVGQHIQRAKQKMEGNLCLDGEAEWIITRHLVPEVFNSVIRSELHYLSSLPAWAQVESESPAEGVTHRE